MLLKDCLPYLSYEFTNEAELIRAIQELSQKFTVERENISDYLKDHRLASAYTAFYLTTNIPKLAEVFKWLPKGWTQELAKCDFVDLGAGPGTFSLAFKELCHGSNKFYQIETSSVMREQARKLWEGLHPETQMEQLISAKPLPKSFLLFGHSANEMGAKEAINYIKRIDPDHVLFIEPGTKSFFREALEIRRELLQDGFNILYPCPTCRQCLMAESDNDWCHQFIHVQHESGIERLSQLVRKDRRHLPLTVHAYSRTFNHQDKERIVRVCPPTKFSYEWDVCAGGRLEHYQVFKRGLDKKTQKELDNVLSGDSIEAEVDKVLEAGKRVRPIKINNKDVALDSE